MQSVSLYPAQQRAFDFFLPHLTAGRSTLDTSDVGTGKTIVASALAAALGPRRPVGVLAPKATLVQWERALAAAGTEPLFVMNYERIRGGKTSWLRKRAKRVMEWQLPKTAVLLVDECHYCKSPTTQNAQLLISAIQQGLTIHAMSATAAEDPTEMRALGYALGLHGLNKTGPDGQPSWPDWCKRYGCYQDQWRNWRFGGNRTKLSELHAQLYTSPEARALRLRVADFPDSFRQNRVFVEPVVFDRLDAIHAAYEEHGITPEIALAYLEHGDVANTEHILVNLLRARQLAEAHKAPHFIAEAATLLEQDYAVLVFVNFSDTVRLVATALDAPAIHGQQTAAERQAIIDAFQADETRALVINAAAGGTGVSLHDQHGHRQRVSLISPSFNAKQYLQVLGRQHRNGAQTDSLQRVLVAAGSVEEHVVRALQAKLQNLETLQNGIPQ